MNKLTKLGLVAMGAGFALGVQAQTIGVSWANFQEERWKTDEAAMKAAIEKNGGKYISADAQSSAAKQLTDIEGLIAKGAKAIVVVAQDKDAIAPAIDKAAQAGVAILGYDRLIEDARTFYLTFDNIEVGRITAREVLKVKPKGNYVFIKGDPGDPNAGFLFGGQLEVLKAAMDKGDIKNVGEYSTDKWAPANAQKGMEQLLTKNNNKVDAVVSSNDGMAGGAIAALAAQGLAGTIPVSGQDGDHAALNRVALGTQTVSVWKNSKELGAEAGRIAVELAKGTKVDKVTGATVFKDGAKKVAMNAILLKPTPITKDNLNVVIDAGWVKKEVVCQGVAKGKVKACD